MSTEDSKYKDRFKKQTCNMASKTHKTATKTQNDTKETAVNYKDTQNDHKSLQSDAEYLHFKEIQSKSKWAQNKSTTNNVLRLLWCVSCLKCVCVCYPSHRSPLYSP